MGTKMDSVQTCDTKRFYPLSGGESRPITPRRRRLVPMTSSKKRDDRKHMLQILNVARELINDSDFISEVLEKMVIRGHTVLWCSVPKETKDRYNVTDIKCFDTWLRRCGMQISDFEAGMKLKMKVTSVSTKGKNAKAPMLRGIPTYIVSDENSPKTEKVEDKLRNSQECEADAGTITISVSEPGS